MSKQSYCIVPDCYTLAHGNQAVCLRHLAYEIGAILLIVGSVWAAALGMYLKVRNG